MSSFLKKHNTTLIGSQIIAELEGGLAPVKSLLARGVATPMSLGKGSGKKPVFLLVFCQTPPRIKKFTPISFGN